MSSKGQFIFQLIEQAARNTVLQWAMALAVHVQVLGEQAPELGDTGGGDLVAVAGRPRQ